MVDVSLHKSPICCGIWEVIGALCSAMVYKEMATLDIAFIVILKFTFRVEQFGTLFTRDRRDGRGGRGRGIVIWSAARRGVTRGTHMIRDIAVFLGDPLILLSLCVKRLVAASDLIQPFVEIRNLIQLFGGDLLQ
jgi:hypothetical protein